MWQTVGSFTLWGGTFYRSQVFILSFDFLIERVYDSSITLDGRERRGGSGGIV